MKLLFFQWDAYTIVDIKDFFIRNHITFKSVSYIFKDRLDDNFFEDRFPKFLNEDNYDAVFSVNYFPLIAKACFKHNTKYLSWCYDNHLAEMLEPTLAFPTNYSFFFERSHANLYKAKGFDNVFHLPLAINTQRLSNIPISLQDKENFSHDISFVGILYHNIMNDLLSSFDEYHKGYLNAIMDTQLRLYGSYIIDELLTESLLKTLELQFPKLNGSPFTLEKEALSLEMAKHVSRTERLLILTYLSSKHSVTLYSTENHKMLTKINFKGHAHYYNEMPKIFKCSKINLNITQKKIASGIPLRALDILGSGGLLLTNYQEELFEYFINEQDVMMYENAEDSLAKSTFLLNHEEIRQQIAYNGYCKVHKLFSYEKQFATLFKTAGLID